MAEPISGKNQEIEKSWFFNLGAQPTVGSKSYAIQAEAAGGGIFSGDKAGVLVGVGAGYSGQPVVRDNHTTWANLPGGLPNHPDRDWSNTYYAYDHEPPRSQIQNMGYGFARLALLGNVRDKFRNVLLRVGPFVDAGVMGPKRGSTNVNRQDFIARTDSNGNTDVVSDGYSNAGQTFRIVQPRLSVGMLFMGPMFYAKIGAELLLGANQLYPKLNLPYSPDAKEFFRDSIFGDSVRFELAFGLSLEGLFKRKNSDRK